MTDTLHEAMDDLATSLEASGLFSRSIATGIRSSVAQEVTDKAEYVKAADLITQLIVALVSLGADHEPALHAYFVLADRGNVRKTECQPCSFGLHLSSPHGTKASMGDRALDDICGCYCQRKNGGK